MFQLATSKGIGSSTACCNRALEKAAFLNTSIPVDEYRCGQTYNEDTAPAKVLAVPYSWCQGNCAGFAVSPASDTTVWATPLFDYILPAVIFSFTVPRRLGLEPPKWCFKFDLTKLQGWLKATASLLIAGLIVLIDTVVWVFTIIVGAGPLIFSGLYEAGLSSCILFVSFIALRVN